jgi:hypothetical protein
MAEQTGATPPAGESQSQADTTQTSAHSPADSGQQSQPNETPEVLRGKLEKSVQAEKNLRLKNKELEAAAEELKKLKDKDLSEVERLTKKLAEQEKAAADAAAETRKLKVQVIAQANGYRPDAAALWLGTQQLEDYSDDAIKTALGSAPDWVKAQQGTTTQANNPNRQGGKEISRAAYDKMSLAEQGAYIRGGGRLTD